MLSLIRNLMSILIRKCQDTTIKKLSKESHQISGNFDDYSNRRSKRQKVDKLPEDSPDFAQFS